VALTLHYQLDGAFYGKLAQHAAPLHGKLWN